MNKDFKVHIAGPVLRRFEGLKTHGFSGTHTVVKVKKIPAGAQYTLRKIKWSRYRLINKIIKLWLKIKYI